jgi:tetratricopeptide (TPR) repeat protein
MNIRILLLLVGVGLSVLGIAKTGVDAANKQADPTYIFLRQGIEKAFNLETQSAMALFQKAVDLDRENPLAYAFIAMAHMFFYEMNFDLQERAKEQEAMLKNVSEAIAKGRKRIEKNDRDSQAHFAMMIAKIVEMRWAILQKKYVTVAKETANVWTYIDLVKSNDPQNDDLNFPMGLLHYHLDHLPAAVRFFSSWLITEADSRKGLQELEKAARNGYLFKELAQAELASVYSYYEKEPAKALPINLELKGKFPRNYNFTFALANTLSELQRFPEAFTIAQEIEMGIKAGQPPFAPQLQPRYDHLMGRILFNQEAYVQAAEYFQKSLAGDPSLYNARTRTSSFVRLGMIYDIRKERKQAEECYRQALVVEGGEGSAQSEAKKYLKTPYSPPPKQRTP